MVRIEELLNYPRYNLKQPEDKLFEVTGELKEDAGKTMLFLGIQGKRMLPTRQNICFLLDVSGSMSSRSETMVMSIMAVVSRMKEGDLFRLVTYSSEDEVVINGLKLKAGAVDDIIHMLMKRVKIWGGTYGSAGINKAYEIVEENHVTDGVNRVIILTDGDLNFGITSAGGLKALIEEKKKTGAYFSAIGTGIYNLQDDKLEALAKNGNGNYFVVNEQRDIERSIVENYESLVFPIAKNVKAQVEFNPGAVARYRLIGYENRMLNREDFRDNTVIAEPFGSGSYCVALFELEMRKAEDALDAGLKYQQVKVEASDEIATLTLRWEETESEAYHELSYPVPRALPATENMDKALECRDLADRLRGRHPDELTKDRLVRLLEGEST